MKIFFYGRLSSSAGMNVRCWKTYLIKEDLHEATGLHIDLNVFPLIFIALGLKYKEDKKLKIWRHISMYMYSSKMKHQQL